MTPSYPWQPNSSPFANLSGPIMLLSQLSSSHSPTTEGAVVALASKATISKPVKPLLRT